MKKFLSAALAALLLIGLCAFASADTAQTSSFRISDRHGCVPVTVPYPPGTFVICMFGGHDKNPSCRYVNFVCFVICLFVFMIFFLLTVPDRLFIM